MTSVPTELFALHVYLPASDIVILEIVIMSSEVLLVVLPAGVIMVISAVGLLSTEQSRVALSPGRKDTVVVSALNRGGSKMSGVKGGGISRIV